MIMVPLRKAPVRPLTGILVLLLGLPQSACFGGSSGKELRAPESTQAESTTIGRSVGVLVLSGNYERTDTLKLLNDDGSVWYSFNWFYEEGGKFEPNPSFLPRAFHPDHFLLTLDVVALTGSGYRVIVNEETGLEKNVQKPSFLNFLTWEQYVLTSFAVEPDYEKNPIRLSPDASAPPLSAKPAGPFHPIKIEGEWLQIRWTLGDDSSYGWIRWRDSSRLLVEIYRLS